MFKSENATANVQTTKALPVATTAIAPGRNPNAVNFQQAKGYAGATYDFGILKAYVSYVSREAMSNVNPSLHVERTA